MSSTPLENGWDDDESVRQRRRMGPIATAMGTLSVVSLLTMAAPATVGAGTGVPTIPFRVFAHTTLRLTDIAWTGRQFLYVDNTTNRVAAAGPAGSPLHPFAAMPRQVEETRCRPSPGAHGFAAGALYCHAPDNKIYRISPDGATATLVATLPHAQRSDGALTFDTVGAFGYALLAATGRSGGATPRGGSVFAITPRGQVRRIGDYRTPGGADEIVVAPARFGAAGGDALLAVDAGKSGSLVAMDARGRTRTLLALPDGPNPLVVIAPGQTPSTGAARPGLYVTDTLSHNVFVAPAAALTPFTRDIVVGSELHGIFWVVRPQGRNVTATRLPTTLAGHSYNLEGALYVAG